MLNLQNLKAACLATCLTAATYPVAAYNGPDPDEGGIGGTGNIDEPSTERPETIERPERPERIEHFERPDIDSRSADMGILESVSDFTEDASNAAPDIDTANSN